MTEIIYTLHNKKQVNSIPPGRDHHILAKRSKTENGERYFLKTYANKLVNPAEISIMEMRKYEGCLVPVRKEIYDKYHAIINGNSRTPIRSLEQFLDG